MFVFSITWLSDPQEYAFPVAVVSGKGDAVEDLAQLLVWSSCAYVFVDICFNIFVPARTKKKTKKLNLRSKNDNELLK